MKFFLVKYIAFGILAVLLLIMGVATILENLYGREIIMTRLYGSWWFVCLWTIMGIASVIYILRKKLVKQSAAFLLHVSFVIILVGAFTTYVFAERGYMHIRQGQILNYYLSETTGERLPLPFNVKLLLFDISYHPGTDQPADFISFLKIDEEVCTVKMNNIYKEQGFRLYQLSYDSDEMGSTLLVNHDPWGIGITYAGYFLLFLAMGWILCLRLSWKQLLFIILPVAVLCYYISQMNPMTPILRSPMLAAHVSVIMVSYGLLIIIAIISILALCKKEKRKNLYDLNSKLLFPALFLLIAGIFIGAVWANISWGRYWGWDAKETWALITMIIYAFPMHKSSLPWFRSTYNFHIYCSFALLTVAMTFFGVSFLLGGIHSYI